MTCIEITTEQQNCLEHACNNQDRFMTAADDPDMLNLVKAGLMNGPIRAGFLSSKDAYFTTIRDGRSWVADMFELSSDNGGSSNE